MMENFNMKRLQRPLLTNICLSLTAILLLIIFHNRIKVRGHNMFWAVDRHEPKWLTNMSGQPLLQEMHSHVNGMISHSKGT